MAAVYGVKENKSLVEQMKVIEVILESGSSTQTGTIDLPAGWTTNNCLILQLFVFNERGNSYEPVLKAFDVNTASQFSVTYDGSTSGSTFFAVLIKK